MTAARCRCILAGAVVWTAFTGCSRTTTGLVSPSTLFRGRTTTIVISAASDSFSDASRISIAGGTITVGRVEAIAGGGLRAQATVPVNFAADHADVAVDGVNVAGGVDIADAIKLGARVRIIQGDTAELSLRDVDPAHPFDDTVTVDAGADMLAGIAELSRTSLTVVVGAGPGTAPGAHDLTVKLGSGVSARLKAAVMVEELPAAAFTPRSPRKLKVVKGRDRIVLKISGLGDKLLDVHVEPDGTNAAPRVALVLIDPATGFRAPLAVSFSRELLAVPKASDNALLHVVMLDAPFDRDQILLVGGDLVAPALANETEPNDDFTTANPLTPPVLVTATLGRKSDVDVFALSVTAGTLVVRTLPNESVKSPYATDTKIDVFDADGTFLASNEDEYPNSPYSFAIAPVRAGTVFVRVSSGADAFTEGGAYRLAAVVR